MKKKPNCRCSICGCYHDTFNFKNGYVCENCLAYLRDEFNEDGSLF